MTRILFIWLTICTTGLYAQTTDYNFSNLADSIKKDAHYIMWDHLLDFEVINEGTGIEKGRYAVGITNPHADGFRFISVPYRKGETVVNFNASILDANGFVVKKLKQNEIKDISAVSGSSFFEDDRLKYADFTHFQYPYTLVFSYEKKVEGLYNYPSKKFRSSEKMVVLNSDLRVTVPVGFRFKYKAYNMDGEVQKKVEKGKEMYTWNVKNLMLSKSNDMLPHYKYFEKCVNLSPVDFIEGGYKGKLESWEDLGFWINSLNAGRDQLSDATKQKITDLVKDCKTDREKVKAIYEYMQGKTRYVAIMFGIGGYQPYSADYVDTKGYGECKALSNYMHSLLKAAKIKSYYALISAGGFADDIETNFPMNQFNHVILCVPMEKDTVWLECTSQKQPFNFLGSFTNDRHALLITEDGGKLVKTTSYPKKVNTQHRTATIEIDGAGNAKALLKTVFGGLQYENREGVIEKSQKDRHDFLKTVYPISGMDIKSAQFLEKKSEIPSITEELELYMPLFASISSKRMFLKLNQFASSLRVPKNEERTIPFELRYGFIDTDTVHYIVPQDYTIESLPKSIDLNTKFGQYFFSVTSQENKIAAIRNFASEKNTFDAKDFKEYYDFKKQIANADKSRIVLVKKN
jgi:hypothetical protein